MILSSSTKSSKSYKLDPYLEKKSKLSSSSEYAWFTTTKFKNN